MPRPSPGVQTLLEALVHKNRRIIKAAELCPQKTATMQAVMYKYFSHNSAPIDDIPYCPRLEQSAPSEPGFSVSRSHSNPAANEGASNRFAGFVRIVFCFVRHR